MSPERTYTLLALLLSYAWSGTVVECDSSFLLSCPNLPDDVLIDFPSVGAEALWTKFDINSLTKGAEDFDKQVRRMPKETWQPCHAQVDPEKF